MKQEDTRERILEQALELFSEKGYDSVSVGEIARAVGIKAPSLYNHFPSKRAIFDAIVESTAAQYEADTGKIDIHVQNVSQDIPVFTEITAEALFEKVRVIDCAAQKCRAHKKRQRDAEHPAALCAPAVAQAFERGCVFRVKLLL